MTITRWNPMSELMNLQREFDRVFSGMKPRSERDEAYESAVWSPMVDITENVDQYTLHFDIPGVLKEDVKINFADNTLTISGERKAYEEQKEASTHRIERVFGKFYRSFSFPALVKTDNISATFADGVLTIVVPKADESKPKQIEIK